MNNASRIRRAVGLWNPDWAVAVLLGCSGTVAPAEIVPVEARPDALGGNWEARSGLAGHGVAPFATLTLEVWGNASGGVQQRGWCNSLLDFGVEFDTGKLGWWPGGRFVAQANWVANLRSEVCFDDYTGGFNPVSGIMAGNQLRVFNLHYQHSWSEDVVVLKVGQIAVDDDFMGSDYAGLFLNSAFGAMPSQVGTPLASSCGNPPAFPIYSVAAPGIFLAARPWEPFTTQLGVYAGRVGFDEPGNHGFDWVDQTPMEMGLFWESSLGYTLAGRPATVRAGLSYHTGPLDDFSAANPGDISAITQAVPNYYLIHDLALLGAGEGGTRLGVFARVGITPARDSSLVAAYADAGLTWFGPLPGRPDDLAGVAVSHTRFGRAYRESVSSGGIGTSQTTLELAYQAQATPWMRLVADSQFLFNPAVGSGSGASDPAIILGLRAEIRF